MYGNSVESQYVIRPYAPTVDLLWLLRLLTEVEAADQDGEDVTEAFLHEQLTWRNHNPELDCCVVEEPGKPDNLIGYASVSGRAGTRCTLYVAVHPDWRRQRLGSALLARAIHRAGETGAIETTVYAGARNDSANAFLRYHNYRPVGDAWTMHLPADAQPAEPAWPDGYSVRSFADVQDFALLAEVLNQGYGDMWGHAQNREPSTAESLAETVPVLWPPEGIFIAFAPQGGVAGLCLGIPGKSNGDQDSEVVDVLEGPGVVPEHRHLELQRPLILTVMRWLRSQEHREIQLLSYGDKEPAINIYRDLGFTLAAHFVAYWRLPN
jgi:mycothiol synthase